MKADSPIGECAPPVTPILCEWIETLKLSDVPLKVQKRAKHLILDGIACGLVGSKAPWSQTAAGAFEDFEPEGHSRVINSDKKIGPLGAALVNGSFIQALELDDYHSGAPLHSASVVLPALFAASEAQKHRRNKRSVSVSGADFLLAAIAGFETGPRAGSALYGADLLSRGWHSGPVFGCPASAAASSKLFQLSADDIESAIGIACTQAGGLMSAQYEGMVKRMQHAFAARNGLLGALLARSGYGGIKKVFDRSYGGFLAMFSAGNGQTPAYKVEEVIDRLGTFWHTEVIRYKLYACVGGCHGQIEVLQNMQQEHPDRFRAENLSSIKRITVGLSAAIFAHDGWRPERPLTATGAQMNAAYIGAVQLVDRQVLTAQFDEEMLDRDQVWDLAYKTTCFHNPKFDEPDCVCGARVAVEFNDGFEVEGSTLYPKGYNPPLDNLDIVNKYRKLASSVVDESRVAAIENAVLNLERLDDVEDLLNLLAA